MSLVIYRKALFSRSGRVPERRFSVVAGLEPIIHPLPGVDCHFQEAVRAGSLRIAAARPDALLALDVGSAVKVGKVGYAAITTYDTSC